MDSAKVNGVELEYEVVGAGETPDPLPPVSIADHAADAGGLLDHLGVRRVHVAGHSNSGPVVLQLALDRPEVVHTLTLLEPALLTVPSADAFFKNAGPSLEVY